MLLLAVIGLLYDLKDRKDNDKDESVSYVAVLDGSPELTVSPCPTVIFATLPKRVHFSANQVRSSNKRKSVAEERMHLKLRKVEGSYPAPKLVMANREAYDGEE